VSEKVNSDRKPDFVVSVSEFDRSTIEDAVFKAYVSQSEISQKSIQRSIKLPLFEEPPPTILIVGFACIFVFWFLMIDEAEKTGRMVVGSFAVIFVTATLARLTNCMDQVPSLGRRYLMNPLTRLTVRLALKPVFKQGSFTIEYFFEDSGYLAINSESKVEQRRLAEQCCCRASVWPHLFFLRKKDVR